jgi:hypothetical protein
MSEELKKEWRLLAEREDTFVYICDEKYHYEVPKHFIEFLLAKQQEEFVKMIDDKIKVLETLENGEPEENTGGIKALADIKSKIK